MEVTRVEQRAYIKVAVLRGRNAMECHSKLGEVLGNNALPYRTVARWVGKFQQGRVSTSDEQRGETNADADGIQHLPHRCGDSRVFKPRVRPPTLPVLRLFILKDFDDKRGESKNTLLYTIDAGPRNFTPWSSDEDIHSRTSIPRQWEDFEPRQIYRVSFPLHSGPSVAIGFELMTHRQRVHDHNH
ncbi:HTH_48 domain-containing protein [Trichonephila clavipes]|nr:HTH_48 domain-containing protein [Trichonephila clavipes]